MDTNSQVITNFEHLANLDVLLSLACIFAFLKMVHNLIKISQGIDNFICDYVNVIKISQVQLYFSIIDPTTKINEHSSNTIRT
jgi:hypothetical protein